MIKLNNTETKALSILHVEQSLPVDLTHELVNYNFEEFEIENKDEVIQQLSQLLKSEKETVELLQQRIIELINQNKSHVK